MKQVFWILLLTAGWLPVCGRANESVQIDGVAAYVNTHVITISDVLKASRELQERFSKKALDTEANALYQDALNEVISRKLIVDDYENQKEIQIPEVIVDERVDEIVQDMFKGNRADLLEALSRDGLTEDAWRLQIREQIIISAMRNLRIDSKVAVSPVAVRDMYAQNLNDYTTSPKVKLRMIVIAKGEGAAAQAAQQKKLDAVLKGMRETADAFGALAQQYSEDSHADEGGVRGWMERDMLRSDLAEVAFSVPVGECSDPVDIGKQHCILKIDDRVEAETMPFKEAQPRIKARLRMEQSRERFESWISRLRENAYVNIVEKAPF